MMPEKFQDKYRIPSARAQWWNYGDNGSYFVTICTKNREHSFDEIVDDEMQLSEIGKMAHKYWYHIPTQFSYVLLEEFVVMPNHIHGIITIDKKPDFGPNADMTTRNIPTDGLVIPLPPGSVKKGGFAGDKNPMLTDNLSRVINWYKGRVKFECTKCNQILCWQARFHDSIIKDDVMYQNIKNYIITNPKNWDNDKFNT